MLISLNWINDYVDLKDIPLKEQINRFLLSTAEVESVIEKGKDVSGVVFARIDKVERHPNSQKLTVLQVFDGNEHLQIVCGAPNVRVGMVTALAKIGAVLPGDFKIKKAKVAGVESFGMCASEVELGIGSDDDGIMDVKENVEIGADIKTYLPIDDVIFEIDNKSLTHRPDLWGHYGIAREFSAIFSRPLKKPELADLSLLKNGEKLNIKIEDENCYKYSAISVENITTNISPQTIKIRLNYVGINNINLLADLTNYVMVELGQPLHAFDNGIVKGIKVRKANKGESMLTLDNQQLKLKENSTVICNQDNAPVAIAGVKGGKLSGITSSTTSLLLESANFDATAIRKTSTAVGLRTDSSIRYEKSLDPNLTTVAVQRYIKLLTQINPQVKITSALTEVQTYEYPSIKINLSLDFVKARTGIQTLTTHDIKRILTSLEFKVEAHCNDFEVSVPSFRATKDVSIKEDLVEEIARMYGYDNINEKSSYSEITIPQSNLTHKLEYETKYLLSSKYNFNEVHSYIWNFADFNKEYELDNKIYAWLLDSSNSGQSGIRSRLLPTMLKIFNENKNSFESVKIYEIARVVSGINQDNSNVIEKRALAFVSASQVKSKQELYFEIKQIILDIAQTVASTKGLQIENLNHEIENYFHPKNSAAVKINEQTIGYFGLLNPQTNNKLDKRFNIAIAEIDFDAFVENILPNEDLFKKVSKYQDVNLDFNFKVPSNFNYSDVANHIDSLKSNIIFTYKLSDIYSQPEFEDYAYWTFSFNISHLEKTLTGKDIEKFSNRLTNHMAQNGIQLKV